MPRASDVCITNIGAKNACWEKTGSRVWEDISSGAKETARKGFPCIPCQHPCISAARSLPWNRGHQSAKSDRVLTNTAFMFTNLTSLFTNVIAVLHSLQTPTTFPSTGLKVSKKKAHDQSRLVPNSSFLHYLLLHRFLPVKIICICIQKNAIRTVLRNL